MLPYFTISDLNQVSDLSDNDLFIISRYNPSSREYTSYNVKAKDMGILTKFKIENSNNIKIYIAPKKDLNGDTIVDDPSDDHHRAGDDDNLENQFKYYGTSEQKNYPLFTVNAAMKLSDRILFQRDRMGHLPNEWADEAYRIHIICGDGIYEYDEKQDIESYRTVEIRIVPNYLDENFNVIITEGQKTIYDLRIRSATDNRTIPWYETEDKTIPNFPYTVIFKFTDKDSCGFYAQSASFQLIKIIGPFSDSDLESSPISGIYFDTANYKSWLTSVDISNFPCGIRNSQDSLQGFSIQSDVCFDSQEQFDRVPNYIHNCYHGIIKNDTHSGIQISGEIILDTKADAIICNYGTLRIYTGQNVWTYVTIIVDDTTKTTLIRMVRNSYLEMMYTKLYLWNKTNGLANPAAKVNYSNINWILYDQTVHSGDNSRCSFGYYVDNNTVTNITPLT